jgi:methylated-DNA-[protein]-cysteine S-methyltransferase
MVRITAGRCDSVWFGVAWSNTDLVATAKGSTRSEALKAVSRCVPDGVETSREEEPSEFASGVITMLGELEAGDESHKAFVLSKNYVPGSLRRILVVASAVPVGYVTTYGNIANAAGSVARAVGRVMATNPLYPIVPCHRVVGADMSLVGYGGKQDTPALEAKLERLKAEVRGFERDRIIDAHGDTLTIYPVECVIEAVWAAVEKRRKKNEGAAERAAAEKKQLKLF